MKTATGLVVLAMLFQNCQTTAQKESIELGESVDAHQYKQLRLFPVRANEAFLKKENKGSYLTLSEAVTQKKVLITEHKDETQQRTNRREVVQRSGGAEVNTLYIENTSADTVLILGGEVVEGGNQDRTIAQDVLLPPNSGKIDLSVFCVEHGRWSGDSDMFVVSKSSLAPGKVRKAAITVADQEEVWENVALELNLNSVESGTQALTQLKKTEDYLAVQHEFEQALTDGFSDDPSVIGVIAVAGDEILGCELFASHELFETYYPNLLQSWVSQAVAYSEEKVVDTKKVEKYFEQTVRAKIQEEGFLGSKGGGRKAHVSVFN